MRQELELESNGNKEGRVFRGLLRDFRIYRTALSPAEVQAVMKE